MTLLIPKISKDKFLNKLAKRKNENFELISKIESFFYKKRGYVFKMPKAGNSIILMVSGGLDSIVVWNLLLEKYNLEVFPLFLDRRLSKTARELRSVMYFYHLFFKKYPNLAKQPRIYTVPLPPQEVELDAAIRQPFIYFHPERILDNLNLKDNTFTPPTFTELTFTYPLYGLTHARYLLNRYNLKIKDIFNAVTPGDGIAVSSQSFTSLRTTLLSMCATTNDYAWSFASLAFEKEIGYWLSKSDLIKIGYRLDLPLEKTWSCYRGGLFQCGEDCSACLSRRFEFRKAGLRDATFYFSGAKSIKNALKKIKKTLQKIKT